MRKFSFNPKCQEIFTGIILLILIFVPRVTDLGLFQAHDEKMRNRQSLESYLAIVEGRWGDVYSSNFGATNLTWARTTAELLRFGWLRLQGITVSPAEAVNYGPDFDPLPNAIFNALIIVITYWFARKLFGWQLAALTTALLALDPFLLSEARILRTEAALAGFVTLTLLSIALYAKTHQRRYLVWCGVWSAWTLATKAAELFLFPMVGIILIIMAFWGIRFKLAAVLQQLKVLVIDGAIWTTVTAIVTVIVWPTLWVKPVEIFIELYELIVFFGVVSKELEMFFMGQVIPELPALYYVWVLLFKTTPLVWMGLGFFAVAAWRTKKTQVSQSEPTWAGFTFPTAAGLIILVGAFIYTLVMMIAIFKTERYMMITVSLLDVTAAVGLMWGGRKFYKQWQARHIPQSVYWLIAAIILFLGHGLFALLNHPYYFSYHNPLLGGGKKAAEILQIGSGEVLDRAINYLNQQPNPQEQVVVCGTNLPRCEYAGAGQTFLNRDVLQPFESHWVGADYVVTYIFQEQRGDYPADLIQYLQSRIGPEYVARFQGINYAKVYPAPRAQYVASSTLTGISTLLGYNLSTQSLPAGETLNLKFYWENDGHMAHDMFVQLIDTDGYVWSKTTALFEEGFGNELRNRRGAIIEGKAELTTPASMPPGRYYLKMGYHKNDGTLIGLFKLPPQGDFVKITLPEQFTSPPTPTYRIDMSLDAALTIAGYNLNRHQLNPGENFWLTLFWQANKEVTKDYVVNLRLLDQSGEEIAYWLGRPVRSGYPTKGWQAGQIVQDPWLLTIPEDADEGRYQLKIVIFDAESKAEVNHQLLGEIDVLAD